jgi:hypothetical protein
MNLSIGEDTINFKANLNQRTATTALDCTLHEHMSTEQFITILTYIAVGLIVLIHLGIWLAGIFPSASVELPLDIIAP